MGATRPLRVLGIDPGTVRLGWACLDGTDRRRPRLLGSGTLVEPADRSPELRLGAFFRALEALIAHHQPSEVAIESSFFGKNALSMLRLGEARGCVLALAGTCGLPAFDYSPASVKKAVTGHGNASKPQVARMLSTLLPELGAATKLAHLDQSDAVAVAWCHFAAASRPLLEPRETGTLAGAVRARRPSRGRAPHAAAASAAATRTGSPLPLSVSELIARWRQRR